MVRFIIVCLAVVLSSTGCSEINSLIKEIDRPTARVTGARLNNLSMNAIDLVFDVKVQNPYSVPLPLVNLQYALATQGTQFLSGQADVQGSIPAGGSKTIAVPAMIAFSDLLQSVKSIRPGQVIPYSADLGLMVDAPVLGRMKLPIRKSGQLPVPALPDIELAGIEWQELSLKNAAAVLKLKIGNTNDFPLDLGMLNYALSLGGKRVASAAVNKAVRFEEGESNLLSIPVSFSLIDLGLGAVPMLSKSSAPYELAGSLEMNTPFGPLSMPFTRSGDTRLTR